MGIIRGDIAATRPVAARMPKLPPDRLEASTEALLKDVNRAGLTSFGVAGCNADVLEILQRWKTQNRLPVRVFCIGGAAAGAPDQVDRSVSQIAKMKLFTGDTFIDDVVFGESVYTPLHDRMFATDSDPQPDQLAQWRRLAMEIAKARLPLHVHAELRDTIDAFLDQIEAVDKEYPIRNLRWALAHVNQINASQLERMKKLGMYAAVHPWAVINGAIMHEGFGDGANDMPPLATIQKSGITWGLGSDGTAANQYLPMTALYFAVTGRMAGGLKVMRQPIDREDALIAYTRKNAYFVFQEDNLGSIQTGKLADLVVLDRDYLTVPADQIKDIKPVMTVVGGRVVYEWHTTCSLHRDGMVHPCLRVSERSETQARARTRLRVIKQRSGAEWGCSVPAAPIAMAWTPAACAGRTSPRSGPQAAPTMASSPRSRTASPAPRCLHSPVSSITRRGRSLRTCGPWRQRHEPSRHVATPRTAKRSIAPSASLATE